MSTFDKKWAAANQHVDKLRCQRDSLLTAAKAAESFLTAASDPEGMFSVECPELLDQLRTAIAEAEKGS
jgi:hypothetical protein